MTTMAWRDVSENTVVEHDLLSWQAFFGISCEGVDGRENVNVLAATKIDREAVVAVAWRDNQQRRRQ